MSTIRKSLTTTRESYKGRHRFEHWFRDNQVYFITSTVRNHAHAFRTEEAKRIFWNQLDKYAQQFNFTPWIVSLLSNHDHTLGYLKFAKDLPLMMQRIHGSVAKLVNDVLDIRIAPFWIESGKQNYFDGCLRDALQLRRAYHYTWIQCQRHRVCSDPRLYAHTRVYLDIESAVRFAVDHNALLENVPYARYEKWRERKGRNYPRKSHAG